MALQFLDKKTPDTIEKVCRAEDVLEMKQAVCAIGINDMVLGYIEDLITATREEERFVLGASPRAMLALLRASQARAYIEGRDYIKPDDVKEIADSVLLHRLVLTSEAKLRKDDTSKILRSLIAKTKIPVV